MCPPLSETEMSPIFGTGGGRYIGFLREVPGKMEPIVLFISPQARTTLGIPITRLAVEAVCEQLAQSNAEFSETGSK